MFSPHKGKSGLNYCELSWFMLEPLSLEGQQREFPCAAVNATTCVMRFAPLENEADRQIFGRNLGGDDDL